MKIRRRRFGLSPVRAGEVTVTRRLFRSGDSEYLLNGKICRLREDVYKRQGLGRRSCLIPLSDLRVCAGAKIAGDRFG